MRTPVSDDSMIAAPLHARAIGRQSGRATARSFFPETNGIALEEVHYAFNTHWVWRRVLA